MPDKSSVSMFWRLKKSKYCLVGTKCINCKYLHFPPRELCSECRSKKIEDYRFSGEGEIVSYTIIRIAPEGFEAYVPYAVALIKLKEGPHIEGQIVGDVNNVDMGKKVKTVFRKMFEDGSDGLIYYGLKWALSE